MNKLLMLSLVCVAAVAAQAEDAKAVFEKECAKCHGTDGKGDTKMGKKMGARNLTDAKVQADLTDERIVKAVKEGLKEKGTDKTLMKAFDNLSADDIQGLVKHVRSLKP